MINIRNNLSYQSYSTFTSGIGYFSFTFELSTWVFLTLDDFIDFAFTLDLPSFSSSSSAFFLCFSSSSFCLFNLNSSISTFSFSLLSSSLAFFCYYFSFCSSLYFCLLSSSSLYFSSLWSLTIFFFLLISSFSFW